MIKLKIEKSEILFPTFIPNNKKKGLDKHMHNYSEGYLIGVRKWVKRSLKKSTIHSQNYYPFPPDMLAWLTEMGFFEKYEHNIKKVKRYLQK